MTLTARETMQALLDGKTLECDHPWYLIKLDDKDNIVVCNSLNPLEKGKFTERYTLISKMDRIYEEYPLDFEQALREMLDGKYVMNTESGFNIRFSREKSYFEIGLIGEYGPHTITVDEMQSRWKVVK